MPCAPLIHGAAQWGALQGLIEGGAVVFPASTRRFDPADIWDTVGDQSASALTIVGDAFGRELADEIERTPRRVASLRMIISCGAALQPLYKQRLLDAVPGVK